MDEIYRRCLINKNTKEIVIKDVAYMFDCEEQVYYIIDRIEVEEASTIVNVMFTLDTDYTPVGVVYNDKFDSYAFLDTNKPVQVAYDEYKSLLKEKVIERTANMQSKFFDTNEKFVKVRKRGTVHGKKGNGSN